MKKNNAGKGFVVTWVSHGPQDPIKNLKDGKNQWARKVPKLGSAPLLREYLSHSTLHGLKYVGDGRISYLERFLWLIAFSVALVSAIYLITRVYGKYNANPVIVSLNPTPTLIQEIPFPSITICNMNPVKKDVAERIRTSGTYLENDFIDAVCKFDQPNTTTSFNMTGTEDRSYVFDTLYKISPKCEEMFNYCSWHANELDCKEIFRPIMTQQGFCCNFNRLPPNYTHWDPNPVSKSKWRWNTWKVDDWNPESGYSYGAPDDVYPFRSLGPGAHLGLRIVLDTKVDDYFCSPTGSIGFKVILHNPAEAAFISIKEFMLPPGTEMRVIFKPVVDEATEAFKLIDPIKRHCYFQDEKSLKYFRTYTMINCKLECLSNMTISKCGCVPFFVPGGTPPNICAGEQRKCADELYNKIHAGYYTSWTRAATAACGCINPCFELNYEKSISYGRLSTMVNIRKKTRKNMTVEYFVRNAVSANFYFVTTQVRKYRKSELYGFSEFLSSIGGILGLFLGFSWLSVMEILYYLIIKNLCKKH